MLIRFMRIVSQPPQEQFDLLLEAVNEVLKFCQVEHLGNSTSTHLA
jgi:hypothetical protein